MKIESFSKYLINARLEAGFNSLDEAVNYAANNSIDFPSKSSLSLYERGKVASIKPYTLRCIAKVYKLDYQRLARIWFEYRFGFYLNPNQEELPDYINRIKTNSIELTGPTKHPQDKIEIYTLNKFIREQSKLNKGSQVGIAVSQFLDNSIFFDVVKNNLKKGVKYFYLLPSSEYANYKILVNKLEKLYPKLGTLNNKNMFFVSRAISDFPINFVIFIDHKKNLRGYVGLTSGTAVEYYQVADAKLSWRLYDSFCWTMIFTQNKLIKQNIAKLELEFATETNISPSFLNY